MEGNMGYGEALETAGAKVLLFKEFGSYQGDWWAKVQYNGREGWINGSYGSCSGCDSFQAEFGCESHLCGEDEYYDPFYNDDGFRENCTVCQNLKKKLKSFGEGYLDNIYTQEEAEKKCSENIEWDSGAEEMLNFIKGNALDKIK
jgi:hypothetical protein